MKIYFAIWACGFALVQEALAGQAGTAVVEQRTQSFTITLNGSVGDSFEGFLGLMFDAITGS